MKKILLNKIVIPAILGITILVAGIFAFIPIDKATTVHTTIQATITDNRNVAVHVNLDGIPGGATILPVLDVTTPGEASEVHIAVTAAVAVADGACTVLPVNMEILVGSVGDALDNVAGSLGSATTLVGTNGTKDICLFHGTFTTSSAVITAAKITDVAVKNNGSVNNIFAELESITVTATIKD